MTLFSKCLLLIIFIISLFSNSNAQESRFQELIVFGDSLSDTGNLASASLDFPFPFYENRISDGPVLVDYLAQQMNLSSAASEHTTRNNAGTNYAVSGGNIIGNDVEDLESQVTAFLERVNGSANSSALYFLMMGGNDLRDIRSETSNSIANTKINVVRDQFLSQLNRLYDAGARAFLVSNVANIGDIPETIMLQQSDPNIVDRAQGYVVLYNSLLSSTLNDFSNRQGVSLRQFDLFSQLNNLLTNARTLGFTQTQVGCFTLSQFSFHPDCALGGRFDRFVFFDNLHPTAKTNQLIAPSLINSIPSFPNLSGAPSRNPSQVIIAPIFELLLPEE